MSFSYAVKIGVILVIFPLHIIVSGGILST